LRKLLFFWGISRKIYKISVALLYLASIFCTKKPERMAPAYIFIEKNLPLFRNLSPCIFQGYGTVKNQPIA